MKLDDQLLANVEAVFGGYCRKPSTEWTWEKVVFAVAWSSFGAPPNRYERVSFKIRGKEHREKGTPSDQWNSAILAAAARVRQLENPGPHDYHKDMYADPEKRKLAARRIAEALCEELARANLLLPPNATG